MPRTTKPKPKPKRKQKPKTPAQKKALAEAHKRWSKKNPDKIKAYAKKYRDKVRAEGEAVKRIWERKPYNN